MSNFIPGLPPFNNINIIGFSLTGYGDDSSFGALLKERLLPKGWEGWVREISYGGLSVNALAGLIDGAARPVREGDLVVLELATSFFSLQGYKLTDALPYVFHIASYFVNKGGVEILFLNLYRSDLDDNDCVVQAIQRVASYFNIPILDLKAAFRSKAATSSVGTTDGVHPDLDSRRQIALEIDKFISKATFGCLMNRQEGGPAYRYFDLVHALPGMPKISYEARGKGIEALVAMAGDEIFLDFGCELNVVGFCFLYGPETGFVSVEIGNSDAIELITFDEHSYYRRIGFRPVNRVGRSLKVSVLPKTRDIALVRPTALKIESRRDFICGLVIKDDCCRLPHELQDT